MNRKIATLLALLVGVVGTVAVASPAAAAIPTVTGTAVCDAVASNWTVTWNVLNQDETPTPIDQVVLTPGAPVSTLTGIASGDLIPPKSAGPLIATSIVHSYAASKVVLLLKFRSGGFATSVAGTVNLPSVCGNPIRPTVTLQSRCDDLLATVALPAGGYPVNVEVSGSGLFSSTLQLQPGAPAQSVAVPWQEANPVTVNIRAVTQLATANWTNPATCLPPSVGSYQLFAPANYRYVRATTEHTLTAAAMGGHEADTTFEFYDAGAGDVAIRATDRNRFLTVSAETGAVEPNSLRILGDNEKFRITTNADGTVSLRAKANAKYLTADPTGAPLVASKDAIGVTEKFTRYAPLTGPGPLLSLINGRYVTADSAGTKPLIANREVVGHWEQFQIEDLGAGLVALKALVNGKYVCADGAGTKPLIANRATVGPWETFRLVTNADLSISFQATINNKYVTAESAGTKPLIANRATIGPWEKFHEPF
ncbi:hypothetical protein DFJ67_8480 [Asanoa ferruginea]|uniref:Fascin domain-containing protein n=1 Tax=Asanoa ferruginea TaxID=53367 RepID=A0A3E0A0E6_9ACTN|nr:hypothetical protein DFJ67_8480 [Asanoa ferruginea]GIF46620.1 hypothetical protein Afe04nite_11590 [Asanoa ferruginea]